MEIRDGNPPLLTEIGADDTVIFELPDGLEIVCQNYWDVFLGGVNNRALFAAVGCEEDEAAMAYATEAYGYPAGEGSWPSTDDVPAEERRAALARLVKKLFRDLGNIRARKALVESSETLDPLSKDIPLLKPNDRVVFLKQEEDGSVSEWIPLWVNDTVNGLHMGTTKADLNNRVFGLLGLDAEAMAGTAYGYSAPIEAWPRAKPGDFLGLTRLVNALKRKAEEKGWTVIQRNDPRTKVLEQGEGFQISVGEACFDMEVQDNHIACLNHPWNNAPFRAVLGLHLGDDLTDDGRALIQGLATEAYGYPQEGGDWPCFKEKDFKAATRCVQLLNDLSYILDCRSGCAAPIALTSTATWLEETTSHTQEAPATSPEGAPMAKTLDTSKEAVAVAKIEHFGEKLILPESMTLDQAIDLIQRRKTFLEEPVSLVETFDAFPWDGAHALDKVLTRKFGWAPAEATPGFFGPKPPAMISVEIAPGVYKSVVWGRFSIPGSKGDINCDTNYKEGRLCFSLNANVLRKDETVVQDIFAQVRKELAENSIYRGKAIRVRFKDDNGKPLPIPEPKFMDTTDVDEGMLVYSDLVQSAIRTNLFTPIERVHDCIANGINVKRGVLLGGTYGTGKTMAAKVASRKAVENNITFVYVQRADELKEAIQFARQYQNPSSVVFCEDIDRAMDGERTVAMDDILNIVDGIDSKTTRILVVLTTNHLDNINPAMLRPGRLDAVIEVTPPDAKAVEKLIRLYAGGAISPGTDLTEAGELLADNIPAVIAEVVKRAKLAQLSRQEKGTLVTSLTQGAILEAAETMQAQIKLLNERINEKKPDISMESIFEKIVSQKLTDHTKEIKDSIEEHA